MRNIIFATAAIVALGLAALFVGSSDNEARAQRSGITDAVAKCLLANLKNANSDAAAVFVLEACQRLNR